MDVLVVGASRGTGQAVVKELAAQGHRVTAFARSASRTDFGGAEINTVDGDVYDAAALEKAVIGQDAVVVTLGISENPINVLLRRAKTPTDVRSAGTRNTIEAMTRHGVRRLIVQTTYGLGQTRKNLSLSWKLTFSVLLRPQIKDHDVQERLVRTSGLDWTLIQPVGLTDEDVARPVKVSLTDETVSMEIGRGQVAAVEAEAITRPDWVGEAVSLSA
ncbi:NAD(P)-dependent oxidoreductase [Nocardioides speluncae]|uniref:NAD(P)-dependent oxidoreductase n=1 Tax=Nocardioides speluncae TaxID=2670337 RepID=UPI000D68A0BB|nr:NAD(P)-binding oxidoreductase [Nocardioides speluncae]